MSKLLEFGVRENWAISVNAKLSIEFKDNCICLPEKYNPNDYNDGVQANIISLNREYFLEVLNYCKLHSNVNSQSKPSKLIGLISDYYQVDNKLLKIEPVSNKEDDIDIRQAQKNVVRLFFSTLERNAPSNPSF